MEEFRDIPGWEGFYQVSTKGRVKSLSRIVIRKNGVPMSVPEKILKPRTTTVGYLYISLHNSGTPKNASIHRLVLLAFIGPAPIGLPDGMHLDDDQKNNNLSNLKWGSTSENTQQTWNNKRRTFNTRPMLGAENPMARKVVQLNTSDLKVVAVFNTVLEAARLTNIRYSSGICACCKGITKTAGGYAWKYYEDHLTSPATTALID